MSADSPVSLKFSSLVFATSFSSRYISYPNTPASSVEAFHIRLIESHVLEVYDKLDGVVGTCKSTPLSVDTSTPALISDSFPAKSYALIVYVYIVSGDNPVSLKLYRSSISLSYYHYGIVYTLLHQH